MITAEFFFVYILELFACGYVTEIDGNNPEASHNLFFYTLETSIPTRDRKQA